MYALPVKQLSAKSKHLNLREAFTLLVDYSHNMDPKQIICIKSQIRTLY